MALTSSNRWAGVTPDDTTGRPQQLQSRQDCSMTSDELAALADFSIDALTEVVDADWVPGPGAGMELLADGRSHGRLPLFLRECRSVRERSPDTSVRRTARKAGSDATGPRIRSTVGNRSAGRCRERFTGTVTASDSVLELGLAKWCARGHMSWSSYPSTLCHDWQGPRSTMELCRVIMESDALWMRQRARKKGIQPWAALLLGSGRPEILQK